MPTKEQTKDMFRDAFERSDTDGTGRLTRDQLGMMMGTVEIQPDPRHIERLFNFMDIDKNGSVDLSEFAEAMMQLEHLCFGFSIMRMRFLFNKYDVDNTGVITRDNLIQLTKQDSTFDIDEETLNEFMNKCDINGDGEILFDEFAKVMGSQAD